MDLWAENARVRARRLANLSAGCSFAIPVLGFSAWGLGYWGFGVWGVGGWVWGVCRLCPVMFRSVVVFVVAFSDAMNNEKCLSDREAFPSC